MLSWLPQDVDIPIRIHPLVIDVGKGRFFARALLATLIYQGIRKKEKIDSKASSVRLCKRFKKTQLGFNTLT